MRLGGPVFYQGTDPQAFALAHLEKGYRAAYCPGNLTWIRQGKSKLTGKRWNATTYSLLKWRLVQSTEYE